MGFARAKNVESAGTRGTTLLKRPFPDAVWSMTQSGAEQQSEPDPMRRRLGNRPPLTSGSDRTHLVQDDAAQRRAVGVNGFSSRSGVAVLVPPLRPNEN